MPYNLNFEESEIGQALKWKNSFGLIKIFKRLFFILFVIFSLVFIYGFFLNQLPEAENRRVLGILAISLSLALGSAIKDLFFETYLKKPKGRIGLPEFLQEPEKHNLTWVLSYQSALAVEGVMKAGSPEIDSAHLLYFIILQNPNLNFAFNRLLIDKKTFLNGLEKQIKGMPKVKSGQKNLSESFEAAIKSALQIADSKGHKNLEVGDIFSALAKENRFFKDFLLLNSLKPEDVENLVSWIERIEERQRKAKRFWGRENLARKGSLAKGWTSGYTLTLDKHSIDLTELVKRRDLEFAGHREELGSVERALSVRGINNVLLVGQPGTGRKSIVYHLAQRSLTGEGMKEINYRRVVELDMSSLLAQTESTEEVEVILDKIFREAATAGNIILVIDNIQNYVGQDQAPGIIDISGILAPYLRLSEFRMIGIATYDGLHKNIEKNSFIVSLFNKIEVSEISMKETLGLLEHLALTLESQYSIFISYAALREIISLTDRYLPSSAFPEKAIDLLKEAAVYVSGLRNGGRVLLTGHISKIMSQKTEIPVGEIETKEKSLLLNLEDLIHQRIINQEEAVREISMALRRARSEITVRQGPMGAFLFLGPTGVGKTETSKALAEIYFGSEKKMIRIDMSEFQNSIDAPRLIGSVSEQGLLTEAVRENPFSLVLLDEIEKAHPNILNLFLQVFDEGFITDGCGRKINFKNTIIIATSNAGSEMIIKSLREKSKWEGVKQRMTDYLFEERIFRPELLNRFDSVVLFTPLTPENLMGIAELLFGKLRKNLLNKGINFAITEELKQKIVELGYEPAFGARHMRRVIQEKVENPLAEAFLAGKIERGDEVGIDPERFEVIIK